VIDVQNLRKEYDGTVALDNLTLRVPEGEVYGLIGPNGAGKTTLLRILATLMEPTFGQVRIAGLDALEEPLRVRPFINYMSDFFSLYDQMLVWEYLDHFARCYSVPYHRRDGLIQQVLELVSLEGKRDAEIKSLSRGMRQRLCFARTLLHEPKVLLLDEPASGLDPAGRLEFRAFIKQLHVLGRTIVISSHILSDLADFCTSVGILEKGTLLASGRVADILQQMEAGLRLEIDLASGVAALQELLAATSGVSHLQVKGEHVSCSWRLGREALPDLHRRIVAAGIELISLEVRTDSLEDLYMKISGHQTS
jgi:ABC-2 type transport system ATP-binding protein